MAPRPSRAHRGKPPAASEETLRKEAVYLDNAATTRPTEEVAETVAEAMIDAYGNPSSQHAVGRGGHKRLEDAREFLRGSLGAAGLTFTSGGTEADVLGVVGAARAREPGRVLCGDADHAAITALAPQLAYSRHELRAIPVDRHGDISPEALFEVMGPDVRVVSLLHGHNELGTLLDLDELVGVVRHVAPDAHIHVDLVQSYGKIDFDLDYSGVDSLAVSGHKLHGPRGIGFLALSSKAKIRPFFVGGGQEGGLRGGTENVSGAAGLAKAAENCLTHLHEDRAHMSAVRDTLWEAIDDEFPDAMRLGHDERRLPHVLSVAIPDANGETLQQACARRGLCFSTGSACAEGKKENRTLKAISFDRRRAREVIRLSCSTETTWNEVERAIPILLEEADRLRAMAPGGRAVNRPLRAK